ncbi:MAG TPA: OmpA family protein [Candidatus Kapabacteria bacterium]|jgi:outer membrane protein OmpA-like peptidoglycan-associated protein|nr:OmpA family protein [Candidatus Kapabacteria bacterium]
MWKFLTLLVLAGCLVIPVESAWCQVSAIRDSVVMKDTLVQSYYSIEHKPLRAGFEPMYGGGWYSAIDLPGVLSQPGCDRFASGSGPVYGVRVLAEIPFWGDYSKWTFEPAIYGRLYNVTFNYIQVSPSYSSSSNSLVPFSVRHELSTNLDEAGVSGQFDYQVMQNLGVHAGAAIGVMFHGRFDRSLHAIDPGDLIYGVRDITTESGVLPPAKIIVLPSVLLGASYEVPLSRKLRVQPSIDASYSVYPAKNPYWNGIQLIAGLNFLFDLTPRMETVPIFVKKQVPVFVQRSIDTTKELPPSPLHASIDAVAIDREGRQSKVVKMTIEEVRTRNAYPILNYIFFGEGSSAFPSRYVRYASEEEANRKFLGSTERNNIKLMELYRETLNILGDRLRKFPTSKVTLIGSTSNSGMERNNLALARSRAEAVRDYLVTVWNIALSRISVQARLLPERPSPIVTPEGQSENRRVEFRVQDERVLDPITVTNIEHLATPDRILLLPSIETESKAGILRTYASITAGGVELQSFESNASNQSTQKIWSPSEETLSKISDSLNVEYDVWDSAGNHAHAHNTIPLDVSLITKNPEERIERFSLILFGFDESRVEKRNERAIEQAAEMIPKIPVQQVLIQGFTDETGDPLHNDALSQERAAQVKQRLDELLHAHHAAEPNNVLTEGHGSRDLLYDNRLPEGRFFSRTVNITIQRAPKNG